MKIAHSSIAMQSDRQFYRSGVKTGNDGETASFESLKGSLGFLKEQNRDRDGYSKSRGSLNGSELYDMTYGRVASRDVSRGSMDEKFHYGLLYLLIKRLMLAGMTGSFGGLQGGFSGQFVTYEEYEETSFQASGQAVTEDGRRIDFNIELVMSRSYMEFMNIKGASVSDALCDPLVLNVGGGIADISDQKFFFDIDTDGKKDEISMLKKGSGFLALDRNEDGIINNGSELFGTKSGNGFADLAQYDADGNGWIDENDGIFSKLKVWCKGDHGEDILMDLKKADVGAIYLGSASTEFSLNGADFARDGVIRSTGIFLHESTARVGTVQHVDMAVG